MSLQRKIIDGLAESRYLLFRAPIDTLTTRFMILFLIMLVIPLLTIIFFTVPMMQDQLNNNARTQVLMSDGLLNGKLRSQLNLLATEDPEDCRTGRHAFCLSLARPGNRITLDNGQILPRETLDERAPGLLEKVTTDPLPQKFYTLWNRQVYLMAAQTAGSGILVTGRPLNTSLLGEVFREMPGLPTEIWVIREPVDDKNPAWLARTGNVSQTPPAREILKQLPAVPIMEPREFTAEKNQYMLAQQFLYDADNRKLARVVHILPLDLQRHLMQRYYSGIYLITVISLLFTIVVAFGAGRTITQPLLRLIGQVNDINRDSVLPDKVSVRGVHEINQLAEAFNRMLSRLRQEQKMKDEFVATLTHDLKVPLLAEKQTMEYFSRGAYGPLSEEQREILDAMRSANGSCLGLVNGLLHAYRYASGEVTLSRTEVDISVLAQEVVSELQPLSREKDIELTLDNTFKDKPATLYADRLELKRVLHNLVSNAITNTPRRGNIRLYLADEHTHGSETVYKVGSLQHTTLKSPLVLIGRILVSVQDSGIGFSSEDLPRLFKQFAAGQGRHPMSIGLGLFNCNQVVEAHNGSLWVETTEGEGSAVNFLLPRTPEIASDRRKIASDRRKP